MGKAISPIAIISERMDLRKLKGMERLNLRIGIYFSKLSTHQRQRFVRIQDSLARKLGFDKNKQPMEMILIRQIALNTIRIEKAENDILAGTYPEYISDVEKWLFLAQKERREAIQLLDLVTKIADRKKKVSKFSELRGALRESEDLPKSKKTGTYLDGHERRFYDGVTRSKKK